MKKWLKRYGLDIAAIALIILVAAFASSVMAASLVGQSEPDENGTVLCYYEDFNTGETYVKHSHYVCSSS